MRKPKPYFSVASCLIMMTALLWLTVSTPFVYAADKMVKADTEQKTADADESNLFTGTTEEKSESSANTISEYLKDLLHESRPFNLVIKIFKYHPSDIYFAFHPELICPPPEA